MSGSAVMMHSGTLWSPCWSLYWKCCITDWQLMTVITDLWLLLFLLFCLCQSDENGGHVARGSSVSRWSGDDEEAATCVFGAARLGPRYWEFEWSGELHPDWWENKKKGGIRGDVLESELLWDQLHCRHLCVLVFMWPCCHCSAASLSFYTFSADTLRLFQLLQLEPGPLPFIHALILTSPEEALFFKLNKPETTKRLKPGWLILNVRKETWNKESQTVIICTDNFVVTLPLCATWLKMCLNIRVWALIQGI